MSVEIFIARHGQNEDNVNGILNGHRDLPLTSLGQGQAEELGQAIKDAGLTSGGIQLALVAGAADGPNYFRRRQSASAYRLR